MSIKFANNAFGTLNAGISSSDTSITLSSGQGARFPALATDEYFYITLIDTANNLEVVKCTARSTDVLTVVRAQDNTTARAFAIGDRVELRVTAAALEDTGNPYDRDTSSTGGFALPKGTTAQEPVAADSEGYIRYDTDLGTVTFSNGTDWFKIAAAVAQLSSVTGTIYDGAASTLTLTGSGFLTSNLVVNFTQVADAIDEDVTVTPASDASATVTVPAAVYNNVTAGNVVSVSVTNSDGMQSGAVSKTAAGLPSGGTISTTGSYRVHTFTSSGTLTVPSGFSSSSTEYLVVAGGGGGGGGRHASGAGAGGLLTNVGGSATSLSAGSYTITVGGGGAGALYTGTNSSNGSNSAALGLTAIGGGRGGSHGFSSGSAVESGGSGGSGGGSAHTAGLAPGSGTSGQGFSGSRNVPDRTVCPSGGGAGAQGTAGSGGETSSAGTGDAGGSGRQVNIDGNNHYYAGGGGGSFSPQAPGYLGGPGNGGAGGIGGGGGGACSSSSGAGGAGGGSARNTGGTGVRTTTTNACHGGAGGANTGGGGGGAAGWSSTGNGNGGNGGSGVVIIRYQL